MVQFRNPSEFFFGTDSNLVGEQGAVYNRSMISIVRKKFFLKIQNF